MSSQTPSAHDAADAAAAADDGSLRSLREETERLVAGLPGPLRRVVVRGAAGSVEVEWGEPPPGAPQPGPEATAAAAETEAQPGHHPVVAPLVGTFYRAPEPGAAPFVAEGQIVRADDTVGIVEAMKLMNEVTAGRDGRVSRIVAKDGEMVEFAQVLMYIDESAAAGS
ncbi:MAG TPA: biotin/lipoyl-containing protein [Egibacteraceae bacterium]